MVPRQTGRILTMKHLLKMVHRPPEPKLEKLGILFHSPRQRFLCRQLNGYWCRLSLKQWSAHLNIPYNQIRNGLARNISLDDILK